RPASKKRTGHPRKSPNWWPAPTASWGSTTSGPVSDLTSPRLSGYLRDAWPAVAAQSSELRKGRLVPEPRSRVARRAALEEARRSHRPSPTAPQVQSEPSKLEKSVSPTYSVTRPH